MNEDLGSIHDGEMARITGPHSRSQNSVFQGVSLVIQC